MPLLDSRARVGAGFRQRTGTAEDQFHHRGIAAGSSANGHDVEQRRVSTWAPIEGKKPSAQTNRRGGRPLRSGHRRRSVLVFATGFGLQLT